MAKKHGVIILEHKDWNTKQIWNDGYLMATYRYQPKKMRFKSRMVNDTNQDLAGGWQPLEMKEEDESVDDLARRQLLANRKPLGFLMADSKREAEEIARDIRRGNPNLETKVEPPGTFIHHYVAVAQKETLRNLFDLDALYRDYTENDVIDPDELAKELDKYADRTLISFSRTFDIDDGIPPWVTGLILGYPIENTISLYLEGIT